MQVSWNTITQLSSNQIDEFLKLKFIGDKISQKGQKLLHTEHAWTLTYHAMHRLILSVKCRLSLLSRFLDG